MNDVCMVLLSVLGGYVICLMSTFIGAYVSLKLLTAKNGEMPFAPDPKGDVFTIEDTGDPEPFPAEEDDKAQEHIIERTNKFLQTLGGSK